MALKYLTSAIIVLIATALQWWVYPYSGNAPFILYYPAVILASLYGDGISAIILSCLLGQYLFVDPIHSFSMIWPQDYVRQILFLLSALMTRSLTRRITKALLETAKEKERAQQAESWLSTTLSSIGDGVIATDKAGRVVFMNAIAEGLTEWTLDDARGKFLVDVFPIINQHTRAPVANPVLAVLEHGHIVGLANHTVLIGKNGTETIIEDSAAPIRNTPEGALQGVVLVFRDSNEKYAQQARIDEAHESTRQSEGRLSTVIQSALDAIIAMDVAGVVLQWNTQAEGIFGFSRGEAIGKRLSSLIIPHQYRDAHERGMKHYLETGHGPVLNKRIEISALDKTGREFPIELTITPIKVGVGYIFYGFLRDISERKHNEKKLLDAIKARDDFLSIASHELKTPLTSLKLQAQMRVRKLQRGEAVPPSPEVLIKSTEGELRQLDRLTRLIDEMLDISRISTGKFFIEKENFDLCVVVKDVLERFSAQLEAAKSKVTITECDSIEVLWDRMKIEQVLTNLITNAIKYGAGHPIEISVRRTGNFVRLSVKDHGRGIAPEDQERIFERFERAIAASEVSGLGLGLFIAKQIVQMHGGTISVMSNLGQGSTFTVQLPISQE